MSPYSLPPAIQIAVAISAIFSSLAVIVYIVQLIITRNQFRKQQSLNNKQFKLSKDQYELSRDQFQLTNQGYLNVEPFLNLLKDDFMGPNLPQSVIDENIIFHGFNPSIGLTNVGNIPLVYKVLDFNLIINTIVHTLVSANFNSQIPVPLYPKQGISFYGEGIRLNGSTGVRFGDATQLAILMSFTIEYHDIRGGASKQISRQYNFVLNTQGATSYLRAQNDVF